MKNKILKPFFKNFDAYIFLLTLLFLYFRLILSSLTFIDDRIYLTSCLLMIVYLAFKTFKARPLNKLVTTFLASYLLFFAYALYVFLQSQNKELALSFLLKNSLSTIISSSIVFFLLADFSSRKIGWAFDHLIRITLPISSVIFIINSYLVKLSYSCYRVDDLTINVFKNPKAVANQRTTGMLINLENSSTAMAMLLVYFGHRFIFNKLNRHEKITKTSIAIFITGFLGIINTTSVTAISTCIFLFIPMIIESIQNHTHILKLKWKKIALTTVLSLAIFSVIAKSTFDLLSRFKTYFLNPEILFSKVYIEFGENWFDLLFNTKAIIAKNSGYGINEVHMTLPLASYGILPSICWYLIFFSPIFFVFKYKKYSIHEKSALYMMLAGFITSLHYAGVVAWPNNVVFYFCFVILMRANNIKLVSVKTKNPPTAPIQL